MDIEALRQQLQTHAEAMDNPDCEPGARTCLAVSVLMLGRIDGGEGLAEDSTLGRFDRARRELRAAVDRGDDISIVIPVPDEHWGMSVCGWYIEAAAHCVEALIFADRSEDAEQVLQESLEILKDRLLAPNSEEAVSVARLWAARGFFAATEGHSDDAIGFYRKAESLALAVLQRGPQGDGGLPAERRFETEQLMLGLWANLAAELEVVGDTAASAATLAQHAALAVSLST